MITRHGRRPSDDVLDDKEKIFVQVYSQTLNKSEAAMAAGAAEASKHTVGNRLYKRIHVKKAIDEALQDKKKRHNFNEDWIILNLIEAAELGMVNLRLHHDGPKPVNISGYVKPFELLGKEIGMFQQRADQNLHESIVKLLMEKLPKKSEKNE